MKKFFLALFLALMPLNAFCMDFSMKPEHFVPTLEFYYQSPQPEKLQPMIRVLSTNHLLDRPEAQLFFAAFFSRLLQSGKYPLQNFLDICLPLERGTRRMAAWAIHLANCSNTSVLLKQLLDERDGVLAAQISSSPPNLAQWAIKEPDMVPVFWAAFMADGQQFWLEQIIKTAIDVKNNQRKKTALFAASTLYDYAPRHPAVMQVIKSYIDKTKGEERRILEIIANQTN